MPKSKRELLKAFEWEHFDQFTTDQQRGLPRPELQNPIPVNAQLFELVPPDQFTIGQTPTVDVIRSRKSHRIYTKEALSREELSFLLWATQGVREIVTEEGITYVKRTVPSAGNRHPIETYINIHRVEGFQPGLYRYLPLDHSLVQQKLDPSLPEQVKRGSRNQNSQTDDDPYYFIKEAAVVFIWTAIPYRSEWRYHKAAARLIALDAGHICQNLYIAAGAIGAGTCAVGAFNQTQMNEVIGVDGEDEFVLYMAPVGKISV